MNPSDWLRDSNWEAIGTVGGKNEREKGSGGLIHVKGNYQSVKVRKSVSAILSFF